MAKRCAAGMARFLEAGEDGASAEVRHYAILYILKNEAQVAAKGSPAREGRRQ